MEVQPAVLLMKGGEIQTGKAAISDILFECHVAQMSLGRWRCRQNENVALCMWVLVRYKGEQ